MTCKHGNESPCWLCVEEDAANDLEMASLWGRRVTEGSTMTLPPLPEPALVMTITPDMGANFTTPSDRGATLYPGDVFHCYKPSAVQLLLAAERERCAKQLDALGCDHCAAAIRSAE